MTARALRLLTIAALTFLVGTGAALAAGGGKLSAFEYQQISSARARIKAAKSLSAAMFDCQQIQMQTSLLDNVRADCLAQMRIGGFAPVVLADERKCVADKVLRARLQCLLPPYLRFSGWVATFARTEATIHHLALSRGLGMRCANLLSDPPKVLAQELAAHTAIERIIHTLRTANLTQFEIESGKAMTALAEVSGGQKHNNGPLSLCPHQ